MRFNEQTISLSEMKDWIEKNRDTISVIQSNPYNPKVLRIVNHKAMYSQFIEKLTINTMSQLLAFAIFLGIHHEHGRYW